MPAVGEAETRFGRRYVFLNPDPVTGPGTWRCAVPYEANAPGGGGGAEYVFEAEAPIVVTEGPSGSSSKTEVKTTFDIQQLTDRTK